MVTGHQKGLISFWENCKSYDSTRNISSQKKGGSEIVCLKIIKINSKKKKIEIIFSDILGNVFYLNRYKGLFKNTETKELLLFYVNCPIYKITFWCHEQNLTKTKKKLMLFSLTSSKGVTLLKIRPKLKPEKKGDAEYLLKHIDSPNKSTEGGIFDSTFGLGFSPMELNDIINGKGSNIRGSISESIVIGKNTNERLFLAVSFGYIINLYDIKISLSKNKMHISGIGHYINDKNIIHISFLTNSYMALISNDFYLKIINTFEEKDIKAFKRMKNINKTNLVNRVEIELKKVINQLINNEKDKKKKENEIKYLKKREWRMKTENKKKMKEEEEKIKMAKEMDKIKRKEEEKRIEYLIAEEEEEEKRIKRIQDEEKSLKKEAQKKQEEYQKNLKELRKLRHEKIVEDSRKKELRLAKNMLRIFKEKKRKRLNSEKNYRQKRIEIEKNLKKLNEENEIKNKLVIYKQQKQEIKKLQDEERLNKEIKLYQKNLAKSNKNFKNYYRNKTQDGLLSLAKLEDYNNNQMNSIKKQKSLNDLLKSQPYLNEKERKQKETLYKNQIILNKRKEEIMNKIHEKEKNIERTQYEKNYINYLEKKDQVKKQLEKEHRVKLITQYLENKRNQLREELCQKDKRVEKFMRNKANKMRKKKSIYDEITKEKQQDNEQFEKVLNKKSFDKKSLNMLNEIFPKNEKMNNLIDEFNFHLDMKGNTRYVYNEQNIE